MLMKNGRPVIASRNLTALGDGCYIADASDFAFPVGTIPRSILFSDHAIECVMERDATMRDLEGDVTGWRFSARDAQLVVTIFND